MNKDINSNGRKIGLPPEIYNKKPAKYSDFEYSYKMDNAIHPFGDTLRLQVFQPLSYAWKEPIVRTIFCRGKAIYPITRGKRRFISRYKCLSVRNAAYGYRIFGQAVIVFLQASAPYFL